MTKQLCCYLVLYNKSIMQNTIQLLSNSILHIPFQKYNKDFTFIVNSKKYETSSFIADLLSPVISSRHLIDPTLNEFNINTKSQGDFNLIINLIDFKPQEINKNDWPFIIETLYQLGTENVDLNDKNTNEELTLDNIFDIINLHQKLPKIYEKQLNEEIDYFSSHFYELKDKTLDKIKGENFRLNNEILEKILSNANLVIDKEDDLLEVVNELYLKDNRYSNFYESIYFENIEAETMKRFIEIFDINDLNTQTWLNLCNRLQRQILNTEREEKRKYRQKSKLNDFIEIPNKPNEFDGILNYLHNHQSKINITASSRHGGDLYNLIQYNNKTSYFATKNEQNSWVCFEFENHKVIPSDYIIRTFHIENESHLKSWVLEGSDDKNDWTILDEQKNNDSLKGAGRVHSFNIKNNQRPFKFLRIRQTGPNWYSDSFHFLLMNSIEFYGKII